MTPAHTFGPVLLRKRVERVGGEVARITYEPLKDTDVVELSEGDEFVTAMFAVDPFAPRPA